MVADVTAMFASTCDNVWFHCGNLHVCMLDPRVIEISIVSSVKFLKWPKKVHRWRSS